VNFSRSPVPELAVFTASILVILLFWAVLPARLQVNESTDYKSFYEPVARRIAEGNGITHDSGTPASRYPPGYSILLAGTFKAAHVVGVSEERALAAFTLLCMGAASVLLFRTAALLWGLMPALVSSVMWITYPFALWLTKQPHSEVPFVAFFYLGMCLFAYGLLQRKTPGLFFFAGAAIGLSSLIRPSAIAVSLVLSAVVWLVRTEVKTRLRVALISAMLLGNIVAILPWEYWVYAKTQRVVPLSSGGHLSMLDGLTFAVRQKDYRQTIRVPSDVATLMQEIQVLRAESRMTESLAGVASVIRDKLRDNPIGVLKLYLVKAKRGWYATDSGRYETAIMAIQAVYFVLIICGGMGAWWIGGKPRELAISAAALVLYFWMMTTLVLSILRYMVPVIGLCMILVPGLSFLVPGLSKKWQAVAR
jgi:4-amino-4-deoxy-L-arabinose transferase-like glycosyltransferase